MMVGDLLGQATSLGGQAARLPLRLLGTLAEPFRKDLGRDVRRSLGVPERPEPPSRDPAQAFFHPDSVTRHVHADLPAMVIGGLAALLLQSLHPLAMAGVAEHSNYREDPTGRLRRTAFFVGTTTFGTVDEAWGAIEQVKAVHRRVHGRAPDGRKYSAADPKLVTWVHVAEMASFLDAAQRYGPRHLSPAECDAYFDETADIALALGATWVPRSVDEVEAYFRRVRPTLYAGPQARDARNFLLRGVARRPEDRAVYGLVLSAAIGLLPTWARRELGLVSPPLVDRVLVRPTVRVLCAALRWAVYPPGPRPEERETRADLS